MGDTTGSLQEEHSGPVVDGGQRRVDDCGMERVPQDRKEMVKDDHLQAVGVPGRRRVR